MTTWKGKFPQGAPEDNQLFTVSYVGIGCGRPLYGAFAAVGLMI